MASRFLVLSAENVNKTIIGRGFCDMQNYQCLGKSYHSYVDIENSAYHKNLVQ